MKEFTDIHGHIAWDIDDGIPNKDDAKVCLQQAYADGIRNIIFTPHIIPGHQSDDELRQLDSRVQEAIQLAMEYQIKSYAGGEVFMNSSYDVMIDKGWQRNMNGTSYMLVEFDTRIQLPDESQVEDRLYEIGIKGYTPIIAHAERYFPHGVDMNRIYDWIDSGYFIQINRSSLVGGHGKINEKNAWTIIENGAAHIVASDVHRTTGNRIIKLSDAYELIKNRCGESAAELLCCVNPSRVIEGSSLSSISVQKQSFLKRIFGGK